jgi:general secretion pathway protein J
MRQITRAAAGTKGFTLIEAVVAMLLLAVMSMLAWQAVDVVLGVNQRSRNSLAATVQLQKAWQQIGSDIFHLRTRPFADGLGTVEGAYVSGRNRANVLDLSRGGGTPMATNPSGLTRVSYLLEGSTLLRRSWPVHLSPREADPQQQVLLQEVREIRFEQLNRQYDFVPTWPPLNEEHTLSSVPSLIRVTITLNNGTSTYKIFAGIDGGTDNGVDASG